MKKVIAILIATMAMVSLAAGGQGEDEGLSFAFVMPMGANEIWNEAKEGFEDACAAINAEAIVLSPDTPNDINQMNALVEQAITMGVDGLVTQGVNPDAQAQAFEKLDEEGIPYVTVNSDAPNSNRLAFLGTGAAVGIVGGAAIVEQIPDDEEIVFGTALFSTTAPIALMLQEAYKEAFSKHPGGYREVIVMDTKSDPLECLNIWKEALQTYPEINAGFNICGFGGSGASNAMRELGIEPGEIAMIGIDSIQETLDMIEAGYLTGTMTQNFYRMGYEPVVWMNEFIANGTRPAKINDSGTILVTKDNIDTFGDELRNVASW